LGSSKYLLSQSLNLAPSLIFRYMKKRQWTIVAALAVLLGSVAVFRQLTRPKTSAAKDQKDLSQSVVVQPVQNDSLPVYIQLDGMLRSAQKIALFAEVSGVLLPGRQPFEEGRTFEKGELLLRLDDSELRSSYLAQKDQFASQLDQLLPDILMDYPEQYERWRAYRQMLAKQVSPVELPAVTDERFLYFMTNRQIHSSFKNLQSVYARLEKYRLKAPFKGVLTSTLVEEGALVRAGQQLGELAGTRAFEFTPSVTPEEAALIRVGDEVVAHLPEGEREYRARVRRKNATIDPATQRVQLFIEITGEGLMDGQFMTGTLLGQVIPQSFALDRRLLYGRGYTYVVENNRLRRRELHIVHRGRDEVLVQHLPEGTLLPQKPIMGAYEGMPVHVINP